MERQRLCLLIVTLVSLASVLFYLTVIGDSSSHDFLTYVHAHAWFNETLPLNFFRKNYVSMKIDRNKTLSKASGYYVITEDLPPPVRAESDKYIIYRCQSLCGGLADRQKGIVTSYVVSQMLRRKFGIMMDMRCDFSQYVVPNLVNWVVSDDMIKGKSVGSKRNVDDWALGKAMQAGDLEAMYDKDVMYYQGNIDFVPLLMNKSSFRSIPWTGNLTHHDIYRLALGHLFKLSPQTEKKYVNFHEKTSPEDLVCAHIRIGQSKTMPTDSFRNSRPNTTSFITFLHSKISSSSKIFVATDSEEVREDLHRAFPAQFLETPGQIVHIERSHGDLFSCSGMEKAVLDQFVLSRCGKLIISNSGFSRMSALVRGTDDNLYIAIGNDVTVTKRLNPT